MERIARTISMHGDQLQSLLLKLVQSQKTKQNFSKTNKTSCKDI